MKPEIRRFFRKSLLELSPYQSAREEFVSDGRTMILLDANENPFPSETNRYPDPMQRELKQKIADWKRVTTEQLYLSNGSDEFISQIIMACCEPATDHIVIVPPTFGMYKVAARTYGVAVREVPLDADFQLDAEAVLEAADDHSKIIFIPTPNNPTANSFDVQALKKIIQEFPGLVVVDEAYIEFATDGTARSLNTDDPRVIRPRTFSKAYGMAGARVGYAIGQAELITAFNKIRNHFGMCRISQEGALAALKDQEYLAQVVSNVAEARARIDQIARENGLTTLPSATNFVAVDCGQDAAFAKAVLDELIALDVFVRMPFASPQNRCIRISAGRPEELDIFAAALPKALAAVRA